MSSSETCAFWISASSSSTREASFEILFEDPPTYDQIAFGTPKLRLPFRLDWLFAGFDRNR